MSLHYFLSGASGIRPEVLPDVASLIPYRLLSVHDSFKGNTKVWTAISHHPKSAVKEFMLDSGAFTAFTKGHKQTLEKLIAVYDDTLRKIDKSKVKEVWLINLDVIPGTIKESAKDPAEIQRALDESDENFKVLKKRFGARVLPVYHQTEPHERLFQVTDQSDFIALSFRQDFDENHRVADAVKSLTYTKLRGKLVHGLATTGYRMLRRAHFDTVDSATWLYVAAMGGILVLNDSGELMVRAISSRSPSQRNNREHFQTVPAEEQGWFRARMKDAGVTKEQLESDLSYRILMCAHQMKEWLEHYFVPDPKMEPDWGFGDVVLETEVKKLERRKERAA